MSFESIMITLTIILGVLKVSGILTITWLLVFTPVLIMFAVGLLVWLLIIIVTVWIAFLERQENLSKTIASLHKVCYTNYSSCRSQQKHRKHSNALREFQSVETHHGSPLGRLTDHHVETMKQRRSTKRVPQRKVGAVLKPQQAVLRKVSDV